MDHFKIGILWVCIIGMMVGVAALGWVVSELAFPGFTFSWTFHE